MSKKNKRYREKKEALKSERLIDANKLKRDINDAAKQKGTPDAIKKAQAFNSLIDLQPTRYDEVESVKKMINSLKARVLSLDSDLMMNKISNEQHQYEGSLIEGELQKLEMRFGIVHKPEENTDKVELVETEEEDIPAFQKIDKEAPDSLNQLIHAGDQYISSIRDDILGEDDHDN